MNNIVRGAPNSHRASVSGNTKLVYMLSFVVIYEPINITVFVSSIMQLQGVNMGE